MLRAAFSTDCSIDFLFVFYNRVRSYFSKMDFSESTKIVYSRIQKLEPELASKIIGFLLLQDNGDREMLRLAFSPDNVILSIANKVKTELDLISLKQPSFHQNAPPTVLQLQSTNSYWNSQSSPLEHSIEFPNQSYGDSIPHDYNLQLSNQMLQLSLDEEREFTRNKHYYARLPVQRSVLTDIPYKICHYYIKGFCKHGSSCKFLHENINEGFDEDQLFSPKSLEKLEVELTELLRSKNGVPISIAFLPMLYYEMYSKTLQADGYLTESQRHGKVGYSLTKLLARMRTSICLIERAHGQHSVILAEDLPKYSEYGNEQTEHGGVPIGARQIYLTFPAESAFSEQDVCNYFNGYGPVQDVRLPFQQKRMFGFVTFLYPETVRKILAKGNPHFICGARVLVKPYREKPRLADRKNAERKHPNYHGLSFVDGDIDPQPGSRAFCDMRHVRKHAVVEEYEEELEFERRKLSEFQLVPKRMATRNGNGYSTPRLKLNKDYGAQADIEDIDKFNILFDTLRDGSTSEERGRCIINTCNDHDSKQGLNLPDNPFAKSTAKSVSTVM